MNPGLCDLGKASPPDCLAGTRMADDVPCGIDDLLAPQLREGSLGHLQLLLAKSRRALVVVGSIEVLVELIEPPLNFWVFGRDLLRRSPVN